MSTPATKNKGSKGKSISASDAVEPKSKDDRKSGKGTPKQVKATPVQQPPTKTPQKKDDSDSDSSSDDDSSDDEPPKKVETKKVTQTPAVKQVKKDERS
ncbi:MAG: hypothetical protein EZS28_040527, partial [Streblomastix strix]